jgi:hypothetical protein
LGGGPRTPFGVEVRTRVTPGGMEEFWSEELAKLDSDGDGTTNGAELQDPGGTWRPGEDDPGEVAAVTNPGVPDGNVPEPEPDPLSPTFHRGDPDNNGATDLTDAILIFNFLFQNGDAPTCAESADFNNDAAIDLTDGGCDVRRGHRRGRYPGGPRLQLLRRLRRMSSGLAAAIQPGAAATP